MDAQPSHTYSVLPEQAQEDALHAARLLQVEERPFQRVTRGLLSKDSLIKWRPRQLPTPPPEGEEAAVDETTQSVLRRERFGNDILIDFDALINSLARIQLIESSNHRERERYAAEKAKILETAHAVRDNTVELRAQLLEVQRTLQLRKGYDELATKVKEDKTLMDRDMCKDEIEKLEKEVEDLEQEFADHEVAWLSRKEAFEVVVDGAAMKRLLNKGEPEPEPEPDKDERMDDGEGDESGLKGETSRMGSPTPRGASPLADGFGGDTPFPGSGEEGDRTPARRSNRFLDVEDAGRNGSGAPSPARQIPESGEDDDINMREGEGDHALEPQAKTSEGMEVTVEQVATPDPNVLEQMDET